VRIAVALFITMLVAGGYVWRGVEAAADGRSGWVAGTLSEDGAVTVAFSATGLLNRSVRIVAFDFGVEDPVLEDVYMDKIAHGELRSDFYRQGFRRVVSGKRVSEIVDTPQQSLKESGESSARSSG